AGLAVVEPKQFEAIPGQGVRATVAGQPLAVGSLRFVVASVQPAAADVPFPAAAALEAQGKTVLYVSRASQLVGLLAAADTARPEVPAALAEARQLGIRHIELL